MLVASLRLTGCGDGFAVLKVQADAMTWECAGGGLAVVTTSSCRIPLERPSHRAPLPSSRTHSQRHARAQDPTGSVGACVHRLVLQSDLALGPGAVVMLENVSLISPGPRARYLCVTLDNVSQVKQGVIVARPPIAGWALCVKALWRAQLCLSFVAFDAQTCRAPPQPLFLSNSPAPGFCGERACAACA